MLSIGRHVERAHRIALLQVCQRTRGHRWPDRDARSSGRASSPPACRSGCHRARSEDVAVAARLNLQQPVRGLHQGVWRAGAPRAAFSPAYAMTFPSVTLHAGLSAAAGSRRSAYRHRVLKSPGLPSSLPRTTIHSPSEPSRAAPRTSMKSARARSSPPSADRTCSRSFPLHRGSSPLFCPSRETWGGESAGTVGTLPDFRGLAVMESPHTISGAERRQINKGAGAESRCTRVRCRQAKGLDVRFLCRAIGDIGSLPQAGTWGFAPRVYQLTAVRCCRETDRLSTPKLTRHVVSVPRGVAQSHGPEPSSSSETVCPTVHEVDSASVHDIAVVGGQTLRESTIRRNSPRGPSPSFPECRLP